MANLMDYLDWRGDLTLEISPFNEVDALILAELSFVDFDGIVPPPELGRGLPLNEAAEAFFARHGGKDVPMGVLVPDTISKMLRKLMTSPRFRNMTLNGYTALLDDSIEQQFAALTIDLGNGSIYISFRGTDDTIVGWKEDCLLTVMDEIPAQRDAVEYLTWAASVYPGKIAVGGHSKGGNLAVWAGVFCPTAVQRRIAAVWSNDGPGFHDDILSLPRHIRLAERIHTIVPKSSVVGMLLEHEEDYTVVDSSQQGLMQHDGFSWAVLGNRFVRLHSVTRQARLTDQELRGWVQGLTVEQREKFVDSAFQVLEASGAQTLTDLKADSFKAVRPMVRALKDLDKETREALLKFMSILFMSNLRMTLEGIQEETEKSLLRNGKKAERSAGKKG